MQKQSLYDRKMVKKYLARRNLDSVDVRFIFSAGEPVLLKQKEPGKMKCRALGPYTFLEYTGTLGVTASILNHKGKTYQVSVANLLPLYSNVTRLNRFDPPQKPPTQSTTTISTMETSSTPDPGLPPGATLIPGPE